VPLVLAIVALALYPQRPLEDSEPAVRAVMAPVQQASGTAGETRAEVAP
jgi:hypothetical protein